MATNNAINLSAAGVVSYNGTGSFTGSVLTQFSPLIGGASNAITSLGPLTNGQLVIGSTGASPVAASLTAGTGITITPGAGSIVIAAVGAPSIFPYTVVTGTTQALSNNNGYISNNAGVVTFTLPATAAVGDFIQVDGLNSGGGWLINQNASQKIQMGSALTTTTTGSLASTNPGDCVGIVCAVANTTWIVEDSVGNITVV